MSLHRHRHSSDSANPSLSASFSKIGATEADSRARMQVATRLVCRRFAAVPHFLPLLEFGTTSRAQKASQMPRRTELRRDGAQSFQDSFRFGLSFREICVKKIQ